MSFHRVFAYNIKHYNNLIRHKSSFTVVPLHGEKSTLGITPEYIVASSGVGTIYIFNITSIVLL